MSSQNSMSSDFRAAMPKLVRRRGGMFHPTAGTLRRYSDSGKYFICSDFRAAMPKLVRHRGGMFHPTAGTLRRYSDSGKYFMCSDFRAAMPKLVRRRGGMFHPTAGTLRRYSDSGKYYILISERPCQNLSDAEGECFTPPLVHYADTPTLVNKLLQFILYCISSDFQANLS